MTPEQAITILDALFSKLGSIQRSRLSPAPPFSSEINGFVQEDISFDTISDAIWTLGNNDTRSTLQVFFDQVFSSLHCKLFFFLLAYSHLQLPLFPPSPFFAMTRRKKFRHHFLTFPFCALMIFM